MKRKIYIFLMFLSLSIFIGCGETTVYIPDNTDIGTPSSSNDNNNSSNNTDTNQNQNQSNNDSSSQSQGSNSSSSNNNNSNNNSSVEPIEDNESNETNTSNNTGLKIIGKITYDRVHVNNNGIGLDYNNITSEPAKQVIVQAINRDGEVIVSTHTDNNGDYELKNLPAYTQVKVRVYAKLYKAGKGGWDVKVVDNTNNKSQYVIDGSFVSTQNYSTRRNIHASSGWDGTSYSAPRTAAPFAILGSIYQAMEKVKSVDKNATFPTLVINWSPNNVPAGGANEAELNAGQIGTSHYDGSELYILGDEDGDTDEYDDHVMIHEWGHYFEANFSRADSIGGPHTNGDLLDIRVAFGEGWGNGWSAIATDNPIYFDTMGTRQSKGFYMDIENQVTQNPGWYSEVSIQKILYDLYDSHNDGSDTISLGFKPIYDVLVGPQKTTPAFTSIFSFITYLKDNNSVSTNRKIDTLLESENIDTIEDIYGATIDPNLYIDMNGLELDNICTYSKYGQFNKLYNHRYIKLNIPRDGDYIVSVDQIDSKNADPDFSLYKTNPFEQVGLSQATVAGLEENRYSLTSGNYLLDISDYNGIYKACFNVIIQ